VNQGRVEARIEVNRKGKCIATGILERDILLCGEKWAIRDRGWLKSLEDKRINREG